MSRFRNLSQITLFALLALGGVLLGLKLFGNQNVRAADAVPVAASARHRISVPFAAHFPGRLWT